MAGLDAVASVDCRPRLALSLQDMLTDGADAKTPQQCEDESSAPPRKSFQPYHSQSVPRSQNLEAQAFERAATREAVTTMMLRNIPNKYTQNTLLQEINDLGFLGTYDFFYLPMDVHNRSNVGYAFINFENSTDAACFRRRFSNHRFQRFQSHKIGSVCVAHVQGLNENLRHFENRAVTQARNDQYRPVVLKDQVRIDFDEAVAMAKAGRFTAAADTGLESFSGEGLRDAEIRHPDHNAIKASEGNNIAIARQGLEAAIRQLLVAPCEQQLTSDQKSGEARQPQGPIAPGRCSEGGPGEDADIAHLLSLRGLLVGRLFDQYDLEPQRAELSSKLRYPPGLADPAYVELPPCSLSKMGRGQPYDEGNCATPRTNRLILGADLDTWTPDDVWRAL